MPKETRRQLVLAFLLVFSLNLAVPLLAAPRQVDDPIEVRDRVVRIIKRAIRNIVRAFGDDISIPKP